AATITVNTTDDELNADGDCSLREAITAANTDAVVDTCTAGSGTDTITVPAGTYTLSIAGTGEDAAATGDLDVTDDLTINGAGADSTIIDGGGIDRVLHVDPASMGVTVDISG
ncbi:MAG: CSLREA domain-containing protein, partial [Gemmatimonadales bacterium]|nr:CSLREA domain-containing protein [Gemmatimonadales bacterium]